MLFWGFLCLKPIFLCFTKINMRPRTFSRRRNQRYYIIVFSLSFFLLEICVLPYLYIRVGAIWRFYRLTENVLFHRRKLLGQIELRQSVITNKTRNSITFEITCHQINYLQKILQSWIANWWASCGRHAINNQWPLTHETWLDDVPTKQRDWGRI